MEQLQTMTDEELKHVRNLGYSCFCEIKQKQADLVARYEGQTASKVQEVFRKAKGKVLFIDEAYSLIENREGEFGDEAINTIVQETENNGENTVVIFAGYPDKMEDFLSGNPGLRSRVPFCINYKDYSAEDMLRIAELEAHKRGFSIDENAKQKVLSICETASEQPESGNGRFSRNLVEDAILSYASRIYGNIDEVTEGDCTLNDEDFRMPENLKQARNVTPIGFCA